MKKTYTDEELKYLDENFPMGDLEAISKKLKCSLGAIRQLAVRRGLKRAYGNGRGNKSPSEIHLCWKCKYATNKYTGYCSWAHNLTPVKGWETIKQFHCKKSFFVVKCPIFEDEIKNTVSGTDEK